MDSFHRLSPFIVRLTNTLGEPALGKLKEFEFFEPFDILRAGS